VRVKTDGPDCAMLPGMASCYRITVRGRLSDRFVSAFEGLSVEAPENGNAVLVAELRDQAELYGILNRLRDLGIELIRVEGAK
jgi:hypothetical protein